jgi:pyruvate dehydrogenase E2 component (dihydrolipoamide acetyltransferase)
MEAMMTNLRTIALPDLGEGLTESDLVEWTVAVGDTVELNQVVAEVETAKALVQLPSPYAGVVAELLVEAGTTVPVGAPLLTIAVEVPSGADDVASDAPAAPAAAAEAVAPESAPALTPEAPASVPTAPERTSVLVGYGPLVESAARPKRRSRSAGWVASHQPDEPGDHGVVGAGADSAIEHPLVARRTLNPLVRKLASDLGVDLDWVEGSGVDGAITREDVLRIVSGTAPALRATRPKPRATGSPREARPAPAFSEPARPQREVRTPITGVRKQTAAAMVSSAFTAPHASTSLTVDVTPTLELLETFRRDKALEGHRVTLLTLVAKAVTIALVRNPSLNAHWDEAAREIVQFGYVNLGIAAATPRGLVVPVIKDADSLQLAALADAMTSLTDAARAGTTTPADLAGGTITITNIGVLGVDTGTPILVPGQAAILATGAVRRRPWEFQDELALRHVMTLSVSFDHRLVDGAEAARFLVDVGAILANPGTVLAMV